MPLTKSRVLIVEDDANCAFAYKTILEQSRFIVETVGLFKEMEERLSKLPHVDALVLDLLLPNSKGAESVNRISTKWSDMPIVVVSGHDYSKYDVMMMGADEVLKKPVEAERLVSAVESSIMRRMFNHAKTLLTGIKKDCNEMKESLKENDSVNKLVALAVAANKEGHP